MTDTLPTAIVIGASRGIGAAIAARGAVVVNYASNADEAGRVVDRITADGGRAQAVAADVTDRHAFERLFHEAENRFGRVAMLVNNAGVMAAKPTAEVDWFEQMFAINVKGVLNGCRLAAKLLSDGGSIVNMSNSVIGMSPPGYCSYCASKAAVEALTRSLQGAGSPARAGQRGRAGADRPGAARQREHA